MGQGDPSPPLQYLNRGWHYHKCPSNIWGVNCNYQRWHSDMFILYLCLVLLELLIALTHHCYVPQPWRQIDASGDKGTCVWTTWPGSLGTTVERPAVNTRRPKPYYTMSHHHDQQTHYFINKIMGLQRNTQCDVTASGLTRFFDKKDHFELLSVLFFWKDFRGLSKSFLGI